MAETEDRTACAADSEASPGGQGDLFAYDAANGLVRRMPQLSARVVVTPHQVESLVLVAGGAVVLLVHWPQATCASFIAAMSFSFLASALFRAIVAWVGGRPRQRPKMQEASGDLDLPIYTILVPLYREANVLPRLARTLLLIDYPHDRLDIKIIVEEDDRETVAIASALRGRGPFEILRVPNDAPRTKPRACNYGLCFAHGEFTVIYDAEDRPERDQLRKAVAAFRKGPTDIVCLQAHLNFYNANENWLTRLFALDYALWFDVLLPGLDRLGVPMPLGGTSNHFRTAALRQLGGWDPYNVTEDADLGIRIAQLGKRVTMLESTTFEEAPTQFAVWLRQRSRWLKGYMQTWLVHARRPAALLGRAGPVAFLAFHLVLGGAVVAALVNPLLWATTFAFLNLGWSLVGDANSDVLIALSAAGLAVGHAILTSLALMAPMKRGWLGLAPYGLTVTFYWALVSLAAWRGLIQLATNPFYWEKTAHGISRLPRRAMRLVISAFALLILGTAETRAGAWTLPRGHWQLFTAVTTSRADRSFDTTGRASVPTRFNKLLIQNCYEYGLTSALTVFATPAYVVVQAESAPRPRARLQSSSLEAGARFALLAHSGRLSAQISYKRAGAFDLSVSTNRDPGQQGEIRLLYGTSFTLLGRDGFADLQMAERWISHPRPNETPLDLTIGLRLRRDTMVVLQSFNTFAGGDAMAPYSYYRTHKLELSIVERLSRHWSLQTSAFYSPAGQNALVERGISVSLWTQV
jgi:cellulose synthase/poly-beta-1,6-N-acetylglucosamine synthase-like glycosyltransferase